MNLKEQIKEDVLNNIQNKNEFAEDILYNGITVAAIVSSEDTFKKSEAGGHEDVAVLSIARGAIPAPKQGDCIEIGGETWRMDKVIYSNFALYSLRITKEESVL